MNNEYVNEIRKSVKRELTKNRYRHTLGVTYTAAALAMRYGVSIEKAYLAGLLHDCAKCISDEDKLLECEKYSIKITPIERECPYLLHAKLGAYYVHSKYGIDDKEISDAVLCHTTGQPNMSMLQKIIFVADYIEPHRDRAERLSYLRELAFDNIDRAVFEITSDTLNYLKKLDQNIDTSMEDTYEYYKN